MAAYEKAVVHKSSTNGVAPKETLVTNLKHEVIFRILIILAHLPYADLPEDDPCLLAVPSGGDKLRTAYRISD